MSPSRIEVQVTPRAAADSVRVESGRLRVRVTAPPVDSAANRAVIRVVSRALGLRTRDVEIVAGASARRKVLSVTTLDQAELAERLAGLPIPRPGRDGR